jgi:hypothetical protein
VTARAHLRAAALWLLVCAVGTDARARKALDTAQQAAKGPAPAQQATNDAATPQTDSLKATVAVVYDQLMQLRALGAPPDPSVDKQYNELRDALANPAPDRVQAQLASAEKLTNELSPKLSQLIATLRAKALALRCRSGTAPPTQACPANQPLTLKASTTAKLDVVDRILDDAQKGNTPTPATTENASAQQLLNQIESTFPEDPSAPAAIALQIDGAVGTSLAREGVGWQIGASLGLDATNCCGVGAYIAVGNAFGHAEGADSSFTSVDAGLEANFTIPRPSNLPIPILRVRGGRASTAPDSNASHRAGYAFGAALALRLTPKPPLGVGENAATLDVLIPSYVVWGLGERQTAAGEMGDRVVVHAILFGIRIGAEHGIQLH